MVTILTTLRPPRTYEVRSPQAGPSIALVRIGFHHQGTESIPGLEIPRQTPEKSPQNMAPGTAPEAETDSDRPPDDPVAGTAPSSGRGPVNAAAEIPTAPRIPCSDVTR